MKTLEELENIFNSHARESARFLELCNGDLNKLEQLYLRRKLLYYGLFNPTTVAQVNDIIDLELSVIHKKTGDKGKLNLNYYMIFQKIYDIYGCTWKNQNYFWNKRENITIINHGIKPYTMHTIGKYYKTKYGDNSIFKLVETRKDGHDVLLGHVVHSPHLNYNIQVDRLTETEVSELEVKEYLLDLRIQKFESLLNNQIKQLEYVNTDI